MADHIRERIARKLDNLSEDRLYQILDYVEFLESKYAARQTTSPNAFQKFAEGVEDKMRAGRMSASTIAETMGLLNRAVGVLNGVAAAGKSVAQDLASAAQRAGSAVADAAAQAGSSLGVTGTTEIPPTAPPTDLPSASAPSAGAPSAGAPSAGAPSAGAPSAGAPSADKPSQDTPGASTP